MHLKEQHLQEALHLVTSNDQQAWGNGYYSRVLNESISNQDHEFALFDYEYQDRDILYRYAHDAVIRTGPIDFFEFGVFKGESFRKWMQINTHHESRFFGFDCFEGLPEDWPSNNLDKGHFSTNGQVPDIDDSRGRFVKGLFTETLRPFLDNYEPRNRMVIHIDSDLCSSCLYALMTMDPYIKKGALLIFDDFGPVDEFAAFHHYTKACMRDWRTVAARKDFVKFAAVITG